MAKLFGSSALPFSRRTPPGLDEETLPQIATQLRGRACLEPENNFQALNTNHASSVPTETSLRGVKKGQPNRSQGHLALGASSDLIGQSLRSLSGKERSCENNNGIRKRELQRHGGLYESTSSNDIPPGRPYLELKEPRSREPFQSSDSKIPRRETSGASCKHLAKANRRVASSALPQSSSPHQLSHRNPVTNGKTVCVPQRQPGFIKALKDRIRHLSRPQAAPVSTQQHVTSMKTISVGPTATQKEYNLKLGSLKGKKRDGQNTDQFSCRQNWHYVPLSMKGYQIEAFPDTGSAVDAISHDLFKKLNLSLNQDQAKTLRLPNGHEIKTLGCTELEFAFTGENSVHKRIFHVLKNLATPMILGYNFLAMTQTVTKFAHRIKSRLIHTNSTSSKVHLLGTVPERVIGSVNGKLTTAVDDTGSDVAVMSWKEAQRLGLHISTSSAHCGILELVDGSQVHTDGVVLDVDWRFGHETTGKPTKVDFQVVRDLTCNVILSNEMLFQTNAFKHPKYFLTNETDMDLYHNHTSPCLDANCPKWTEGPSFTTQRYHSQPVETVIEDFELEDRAERALYEKERSNGLSNNGRYAAWAERRRCEQSHRMLSEALPALKPPDPEPGPSVALTACSSSISTQEAVCIIPPSSTKRIRWRQCFPMIRIKPNG